MIQSTQVLNTERLGVYLNDTSDRFKGDITAKKIAVGQSNPTFMLSVGDDKYVLRRKPPGKLLKSAHAVDREFKVMSALSNSDVPVARPIHLCADETVIGSMFYIMEYVEGRTFWGAELVDLNPQQRANIYTEMNRVLALIHDTDIAAYGLSDYGKPGDYFARQLSRWSSQYRATEIQTIDEMEQLLEGLPAGLPKFDGQVGLVHGDYRLDNMIFDTHEPKILAVVDWELSTLGHPIADISAQCAQWRYSVDWAIPGLGGIDREALGLPSEAQYVEQYCKRRGIDVIPDWDYYIAFNFFRMAAILQGVKKRAVDGNASNQRAHALGEMVLPLARMACAIMQKI